MPLFDFECQKCHKTFEYLMVSRKDRPKHCPSCKGKRITRLYTGDQIQVKMHVGNSWMLSGGRTVPA